MNNHSKAKDQELELFKRAISEALDLKIQEIDEEIKNVELPPVFCSALCQNAPLSREALGF